jgi:two-component system cell cycle response regulator
MTRKRQPPSGEAKPDDPGEPPYSEARTTETQVVVAPPSMTPDRPVLTLLSGVNAGQMFAVERQESVIGRAREAWVCIDAVGISRRHARVVRTAPAAFAVEDLGSTNGVFVNGVRVQRADLTPGDQVQIGSEVILRFGMIDAAEETLARQLFESSTRDALTGAYNRKYFTGRLDAEVAHAARYQVKLGLLLLDLDHFKKINDTNGHVAGDAVLRNVGLVVARLLRAEDVFARHGGEEFAVIARAIPRENLVRLAERIRKTVAASRVSWEAGELRVTLSVGVALFDERPAGGSTGLIELADGRLYRAKANGRNCVVAQ